MSDLFPEDPTLVCFSQRFQEHGFDPTAVRPIISPATQTRQTVPGTDQVPPQSPLNRPNIDYNSPKRPLPTDDSDTEGPPMKVARNNNRDVSPLKVLGLKGAAGRRMDQQNRNRSQDMPQFSQQHAVPMQPLPPPPLPRDITFLLSIIPKADTYKETLFVPDAMVRLIRNTNIPTTMNDLPSRVVGRGAPIVQHGQLPPHFQHMQPVQHAPPMTPIAHGQYPGQFNGWFPHSPYSSAFGTSARNFPSLSCPMVLQAMSIPDGVWRGTSYAQLANPQSQGNINVQTLSAISLRAGPTSTIPSASSPPA